jgi:pimeloyl-ACP methyl ester carboxylesterase
MTSHPEQRASEGTVKVPGARVFYRVRGAGPWLMLLGGGASDADGLERIASRLTADYTVITHDRRGLSRSLLDDPGPDDQGRAPDITIAAHSEDVHHVLASLGAAPAMIFGSSIGAVIGLDLLIRHQDDVRVLVAHEPPVGGLLTSDEEPPVSFRDSYAETGDADAAMRQFAASLAPAGLRAAAQDRPITRATTRNNEFFITNDAPAVHRYELDLGALKALTSRLVIGGGHDGREFFPYICASRLASRLGTGLAEFPGHHGGYAIYPEEFARSLRQVLETAVVERMAEPTSYRAEKRPG